MIILAVGLNFIWNYLPERGESFLALALLGEGGMAENYYPNDDPEIEIGEELHWNIYLYNHMAEAKYVAMRLKILNSTTIAPNSTSCSPSPVPVIYEVRHVILNNETWLHPLSWSLNEVSRDGDITNIESIMIDDNIFNTDIKDTSRGSFRMILELWVYDESLEYFVFGWKASDEPRCAWNQIWFNTELE